MNSFEANRGAGNSGVDGNKDVIPETHECLTKTNTLGGFQRDAAHRESSHVPMRDKEANAARRVGNKCWPRARAHAQAHRQCQACSLYRALSAKRFACLFTRSVPVNGCIQARNIAV